MFSSSCGELYDAGWATSSPGPSRYSKWQREKTLADARSPNILDILINSKWRKARHWLIISHVTQPLVGYLLAGAVVDNFRELNVH